MFARSAAHVGEQVVSPVSVQQFEALLGAEDDVDQDSVVCGWHVWGSFVSREGQRWLFDDSGWTPRLRHLSSLCDSLGWAMNADFGLKPEAIVCRGSATSVDAVHVGEAGTSPINQRCWHG